MSLAYYRVNSLKLIKLVKAIGFLVATFGISGIAFATNLEFPIAFNSEYLTKLLKTSVFRDRESLSVWGDETGCNDLTLHRPVVSIKNKELFVLADVDAVTGWVVGGRCISLIEWRGKVKALQRADVIDPGGLISFSTVDTELLDQEGNRAQVSNTIWKLAKDNVHTQLDKLSIDLIPAMDEIRELLPSFLASASLDQAEQVVNSFQIGALDISYQELSALVRFNIDTLPVEVKPLPQSQLSESELALFEETWERWDAFLSFVIKIAGRSALTEEQVNLLLETLIDTRYELVNVLTDSGTPSSAPVRESFIRVWRQLSPIFHQISMDVKGAESLRFLSFIAAVDALEALDALGPVTGWDISID